MTPNPINPQRPFIYRFFLSSEEPRLRAGWRLLLQTILMIFLIACIGIPTSLLVSLPNYELPEQLLMLLDQGISLFAIGLSVFISRRYIDKRSISSLGLKLSTRSIKDLIAGFIVAFISVALIFIIEFSLGWVSFGAFAWENQSPLTILSGTTLTIFIFILVGWNEELLSRGYHLQTLSSGMNLPLGWIISSAIFGFLHITNPNATWVSTIGIFFAGLFLGFGYIRTGQIWLSIGLHIGWNFSEGVVFGFPVSGWNSFQLAKFNFSGPEIWTGGLFGPEAGLIVLPALMFGAILIYLYTSVENPKTAKNNSA
jgi:membrane protease YdiL (CAAX protease family)